MPAIRREGPYRFYFHSGDIGEPALAWFPRLLHGSAEQRQNWRLSGAGFGIHWPDLDEDISVHGMLAGAAAPGVHIAV